MVTTFADLGPKQKCIYDAFSKSCNLPGAHLGGQVNAQGVDADDTEAVLILAKSYGYVQTPRGCYGSKFREMLTNLEETTEFIVLVCMGMGNSMIPRTNAPGASYRFDFEKGFDATQMFTRSEFDPILWHAIYVKCTPGGRTVFHDVQGLRPQGPGKDDRIIWFAK